MLHIDKMKSMNLLLILFSLLKKNQSKNKPESSQNFRPNSRIWREIEVSGDKNSRHFMSKIKRKDMKGIHQCLSCISAKKHEEEEEEEEEEENRQAEGNHQGDIDGADCNKNDNEKNRGVNIFQIKDMIEKSIEIHIYTIRYYNCITIMPIYEIYKMNINNINNIE